MVRLVSLKTCAGSDAAAAGKAACVHVRGRLLVYRMAYLGGVREVIEPRLFWPRPLPHAPYSRFQGEEEASSFSKWAYYGSLMDPNAAQNNHGQN